MTVAKKLYGLVAGLVVVVVVVSVVSFMSTGSLINGYDQIIKGPGAQMEATMKARLQLQYAIHWFKNYLIRGDEKYVTRFHSAIDEMKKAIDQYGKLASNDSQRAEVEQARKLFNQYAGAIDVLIAAKKETSDIRQQDGMMKGIDKALDDTLKQMDKIAMKEHADQLKLLISKNRSYTFVTFAVALSVTLAVVVLSILNTRKIVTSVGLIRRGISSLAQGDLSSEIKIKGNDEFALMAVDFNNMLVRLREMVARINGITVTLASSSEESSATASQIASGTEEQLAQIEQGVTATTEVSRTIMEVAQNAGGASETAQQTVDVANEGKVVVEKCVEGIHDIARTVEETASVIEKLGDNSKQIGAIISVINDIADQTNLLALNAAIEAARAGEQGRGFAVVADEVRKLAERTAGSTHEITGMIKMIQQDTEKSVVSMESGKLKAEEGVQLVEQAKGALDKIVQASSACLDMVQSIAAAAEQQSAAIEEVSANMDSMAGTSRSYQDVMTQMSSASHELARMASELKSLIAWFHLEGVKNASVETPEENETAATQNATAA
jgi:methyl-accepting chemotaxis protein